MEQEFFCLFVTSCWKLSALHVRITCGRCVMIDGIRCVSNKDVSFCCKSSDN